MKNWWPTLILLLFFLFPSGASSTERITVCGTGDSQALLRELASAYQQISPDIKVDVPDSIGSSGGIRMTAKGECDLGRVARFIKEKEKSYHLNYKQFAISPVVFIVNESVNIDNITSEQIVEIISGKTTNWRDLGANDGPIYVAKRGEGDSSRSVIEKKIPAVKNIKNWVGKTIYTTGDTVATVANYPGTFSFSPLAMTHIEGVKTLSLDNIKPSPENVKTGRYKLTVPFGFVWKGEMTRACKKFVDFIESPAGKSVLTKNSAISVQ